MMQTRFPTSTDAQQSVSFNLENLWFSVINVMGMSSPFLIKYQSFELNQSLITEAEYWLWIE